MVGDGGSGCLFQPMLPADEYTYVLTAKHLFEPQKDGSYKNPNGTEINIVLNVRDGDTWREKPVNFKCTKGKNYFSHDVADAAILKIDFIANFDNIRASEENADPKDYSLYGFPANFRNHPVGNKDTKCKISNSITPASYCDRAQLDINYFNKTHIEGMSGGALLKQSGDMLSIIGIQSAVVDQNYAAGQIIYIPMRYFNEIVEKHSGKLAKLIPPWIADFRLLRKETFAFSEGSYFEEILSKVRITLRNKASEIINAGITPEIIKEKFSKRLLVNECQSGCLFQKSIWISWLEFLSLFEIAKSVPVDSDMLPGIFNSHRLKYLNTEDWSGTTLQDELMKSDFYGVPIGSKVFLGSDGTSPFLTVIPPGKLVDISCPVDAEEIKVDQVMHPLAAFTFIPLDYLKRNCILNKVFEYSGMSEDQLLEKIQTEYHEYFN